MNTSLISMAEMAIPEIIPDTADYVRRFEAAFNRTIEGVITAGMILSEAKDRLAYGEWESMFRDHLLPISKRTGNRLIGIARDKVLADGTNWSHLPYSWTTLYALSGIPINKLQKAIDAGLVFPEMTMKDVKIILRGEKVNEPESFYENQSIDRVRKFLKNELKKWPDSSKGIFRQEVIKVLDYICR